MNLIQHVNDFLSNKASESIDRKHVHNQNQFFRKLAKKIGKLVSKPEDWIYEYQSLMPKSLLELTNTQKKGIKKYVKDLKMGFEDLNDEIYTLVKVLSYLEENDSLETPFAEALKQNYYYLKDELSPKLYPKKTREFNKRLHKTETPEKKLVCPKCGSVNQLIKNGINYFCKSCQKQTRKNLV